MVMHRLIRATLLALAVTAVSATATGDARAAEGPTDTRYLVIVHPSVDVVELDDVDLQAIAIGRTRYWSAGQPVQLVVEPEGTVSRRIWAESIADMSPRQFTQFWIGATFRGRAVVAPRAVPSAASAVQLVSMLPGAVAIVPEHVLTEGVRVVPVSPEAEELVGGGGR